MAPRCDLSVRDIQTWLKAEEKKDLLRFMTCGSVDDGKSTLIGRLLYDSESILDDQLVSLAADSRSVGTRGGTLDLALLVDGLRAEREQGITIDVAYRFFSTGRRRFIVADTPGHEQYTRNTATGASTADLAVVLVDARKGLLTQTRRHLFIASLFGVRRFVLAVNKMDLVGWDEAIFTAIAGACDDFVRGLDIDDTVCIPMSALTGANVLRNRREPPWYRGPALMEVLETVDVATDLARRPFRMPVQWVNRPNPDFRGFSGTVASGAVRPGDAVKAYPSEMTSTITRVVAHGGDLDAAVAGQSVVLVLDGEIDISRGDVLAAPENGPRTTDQFTAHLLWMGKEPLLPERRYRMKLGAKATMAQVTDLRYRINVDTMEHVAVRTLGLNEIGYCNFALDQTVAFDPYREVRETGGFILIDSFSNDTVGAGMIDFGLRRADNLKWQALDIGKEFRAGQKRQQPCVLWFTGLSGSGKSTAANAIERKLVALGHHSYVLDGDNVRHGINRDLGFTDADRVENIRRVAEIAKLFVDAGLMVLVALISPFRGERRMARELVEEGEFVEIFVDAPLDLCERRDPKRLYRKARAGAIENFTGIDSAYEPPERPDIVLKTSVHSPEELADQVIAWLAAKGYLQWGVRSTGQGIDERRKGAGMDASRHGVFSWCELMTTDVDGAKQFYAELFGWTVEAVTNEANQGMQYHLVKVDGAEVGGIMAQPPQAQGAPPCWGTYVTVDDVDATSRKARELGADIIVPLTDIPDVGRFCVIRDPQGAVISIITYRGEHHGQASA